MINVESGYTFPGLSAAWMLQTSLHGRIHSVSREGVPTLQRTKQEG
jgi:hypothetical protein